MTFFLCLSLFAYGHTNGRGDPVARARTNVLLKAVYCEQLLQPKGPSALCVDLNADAANLQYLSKLLENSSWTDIGACASFRCGLDNVATCQAKPNASKTRNDYCFVNEYLRVCVDLQTFS